MRETIQVPTQEIVPSPELPKEKVARIVAWSFFHSQGEEDRLQNRILRRIGAFLFLEGKTIPENVPDELCKSEVEKALAGVARKGPTSNVPGHARPDLDADSYERFLGEIRAGYAFAEAKKTQNGEEVYGYELDDILTQALWQDIRHMQKRFKTRHIQMEKGLGPLREPCFLLSYGLKGMPLLEETDAPDVAPYFKRIYAEMAKKITDATTPLSPEVKEAVERMLHRLKEKDKDGYYANEVEILKAARERFE